MPSCTRWGSGEPHRDRDRWRVRRESKSLDAVVIDALARGLALNAAPARHTDLDPLIGTWQDDPDFDRAVAEFERIDDESWK
jgi:hypothetical protein